jgi:hypothetical protein
MYGTTSANYYVTERRRRRWEMGHRGLAGYAQFLAGGMGGMGDGSAAATAIIGAETAAMDSSSGDAASRAIFIGVTTGVLTFLLNRWLGKVLG